MRFSSLFERFFNAISYNMNEQFQDKQDVINKLEQNSKEIQRLERLIQQFKEYILHRQEQMQEMEKTLEELKDQVEKDLS